MKVGSFFAVAFLGLVSLAHLLRLVFRVEVHVGSWAVPQWMSLLAFLFCGVVAVLLYREGRPS